MGDFFERRLAQKAKMLHDMPAMPAMPRNGPNSLLLGATWLVGWDA